ncbi:MAG: DUF6382 domain-containing protein [Lachnospiraceae bacterium]|nr:DUF6382 domain-containing protein [Lachnospiraceae bacterium]
MKKHIYHDSKMSYLVIEPGTDIGASLSMNMMKNNQIQCLLDMECRYIDNSLALYYSIQGMQSLKEYIGEYSISYNTAKQLYMDIVQAVLNGEEFFLNEDSYLMDLEYIFWDKKNKNVKFCCVPELQGDFQENIKKLTENIIEYINHDDKSAAEFIYGIYGLITDGGFIIQDVKAYIKGFKPGAISHTLQNKQDNIVEKKDGGNCVYGCNDSKTSSAVHQDSVPENRAGQDKKNKYILCIDKDSIPFRTDEKSGEVCLEDIGLMTGENQLEASIGRNRDCNLILPACYISRHHAVFYIEDGKLYIEDSNSSNGTFINGERIPANVKILCNAADVISFAGILCRLSCQKQ